MRTLRPDTAQLHAAGRIALANGATLLAGNAWARVDPDNILTSWAAELPTTVAATTKAQYAAARTADEYVDEFDPVGGAGVEDSVDAASFAGVASDGRSLVSLLMSPAFQALQLIGSGLGASQALAVAGQHLDTMVRTQVADAGRLADGVSLTAHREIHGYIRIVAGGACSRCVILAGRFYRWSAGFLRHPNCHCVHEPATREVRPQSPRQVYDSLSAAQRKAAGWSLADQKAIEDGAELASVTNAHRGVYTAGGKRYTTEGTSKRGQFGGYRVDENGRLVKRARGEKLGRRLTPEQIYAEAGEDREKAIALLRENGYLKPSTVRAEARRRSLDLAAAKPNPEAAAGAGAGGRTARARPGPTIRPELEAARTASAVSRAFEAEAERITGRTGVGRIKANFEGSAETAREHAEGLLRGLERFPEARLSFVSTTGRASEYAHTQADVIRFNYDWTKATERRRYLESLAGDVDGWDKGIQEFGLGEFKISDWHPRGTGSPVGVAIHEFGHIIDLVTTAERARPEIEALVRTRAKEAMRLPPPPGQTRYTSVADFIRREVSGYAATDARELAAEAFADVMLNGEAASQLSREIYAELRKAYEFGGRKVQETPAAIARSTPRPGRDFEARQARLRRGFAGKTRVERVLGGGSQGDATLVETSEGPMVRKDFLGRNVERTQVDAEVLGPQVLDAVGAESAATVKLGEQSVGMEYVEGLEGGERFGWSGEVPAAVLESDDGRLMGLADLLMGNSDRPRANWKVRPNGRLVGIDHGYAFEGMVAHGRLWGAASPFASYLIEPVGRTSYRLRDSIDLSRADLAIVRRRLEALRAEFEAAGRGDWHDLMMENLTDIEARATGTRNRIVP